MTGNGALIAAEGDPAEAYTPHEHEELLGLAKAVESLRNDRDESDQPRPDRQRRPHPL